MHSKEVFERGFGQRVSLKILVEKVSQFLFLREADIHDFRGRAGGPLNGDPT
jgi:hypothetical protein